MMIMMAAYLRVRKRKRFVHEQFCLTCSYYHKIHLDSLRTTIEVPNQHRLREQVKRFVNEMEVLNHVAHI
jgi:hypothetical protein